LLREEILVADKPKCLCIVSRDRVRGGDFIAALEASLRPDDQLEVIVDRRSGKLSDEWDRAEDRRKRPQVDLALRENGFAVVPAPSLREERALRDERIPREERLPREEWSPREESLPREERTPLSRLLPSAPVSRFEPEDDDDEERLEAIRSFKRERSRTLVPWIVAAVAVAAVVFILSPAGQTFKQSFGPRASPGPQGPSTQAPAQAPDASTAPRGPAVADKPGVADNIGVAEAPSRARSNDAAPVEQSTRGTGSPAITEPSPVPSRDAATAIVPRDGRTPPAERSAPPRAASETASRERSRPTETARPSVSEPVPRQAAAPAEPSSRLVSPRFAGLPRVELSREPGAPRGTYAVRIADPAGKPLGDAEVLLLARMPDGTVENVRMDFYPDHGTYRGTLPPTRSSPVDLRVRVITGDKRVEIPLGP